MERKRMWISINKINDAPAYDCLVAYITFDQQCAGGLIDDLGNLGAGVGHLTWSTDKIADESFWRILDDGEIIVSHQVTALCEIPVPKNLISGIGASREKKRSNRMNLTKTEALISADLLEIASEIFGNLGCNDYEIASEIFGNLGCNDYEIAKTEENKKFALDTITDEDEKKDFLIDYGKSKPNMICLTDWVCMNHCTKLLREYATQ